MTDDPFGIPTIFIALAVVVVGGMIYLSKVSKNRHTKTKPKTKPKHEKKPDITKLIGKPESHKQEKVKSVEEMLAGDIENAPSIGHEEKTNVKSTLDMLAEEPKEKPKRRRHKKEKPTTVIEEPKEKTEKPTENQSPTEETTPTIDIDEFKDELEEPEDYMNPPTVKSIKVPKAPPPIKGTQPKLTEVRRELEKGLFKSVLNNELPEKIGDKGVMHYCMECFDHGTSPVKVTAELRKQRVTPKKAKELTNQTYKLWLEKREPVITQIKEIHERMKRIHYKFLKMQIDEKTRREMLVENQKKLVELETQLNTTENYFTT
ncbi:hypothetical protein K8R43_02770 [archaeon]|nr:hypothetical protein [archaeon]